MIAPEQAEQQAAAQQPVQHIEAETDDGASSIGGDTVQSSLTSLRSSIVDYRLENGRTYHRLSDGKYFFPNDEREMDRLDMVHHLWMLTWDGDICLSPKKKTAKRVLDLGTGTGIWALDYADEHPEATVLGVDLSAIQPEYVPPNCSFEVDDIEKEWTWTTPFDFIFLRYMIGSFTDWNNIFTKAYDHLEPGGYIEIQDIDFPLRCDDGTMKEGWQPLKWGEMLIEASEKIGRPGHMTPKFEQMLLDIGFVDVVVRRAKWPFNPWPKDKHLKELGMWCQAGSLAGIEAASLRLFTQVLDWTPEETTVLCAEVRKEHMKMNVHAYYDVYAIYGRKPEKEASEAPAA